MAACLPQAVYKEESKHHLLMNIYNLFKEEEIKMQLDLSLVGKIETFTVYLITNLLDERI